MSTLLDIKKEIIEIKKELTELRKNGNNSKGKDKETDEKYLNVRIMLYFILYKYKN